MRQPKFCLDEFDNGVALILTGLFKKVLIADNLSYFVQGGFAHPALFSGLDLWIFTWAFAFQIYFDFSGYTDVARGWRHFLVTRCRLTSICLICKSIAEFWHRWHISLSTWLRDYLYISLGGSRCSRLMNYRNLFLTMLLGGLWHGAAMHFLLWGAFHGAMLVLHREFERVTSGITIVTKFFESKFGQVLSMLITFQVVCIGWVLFRAENIGYRRDDLKQNVLSSVFSSRGAAAYFAGNKLPAYLSFDLFVVADFGYCSCGNGTS